MDKTNLNQCFTAGPVSGPTITPWWQVVTQMEEHIQFFAIVEWKDGAAGISDARTEYHMPTYTQDKQNATSECQVNIWFYTE